MFESVTLEAYYCFVAFSLIFIVYALHKLNSLDFEIYNFEEAD
jgi:hypothetical protein